MVNPKLEAYALGSAAPLVPVAKGTVPPQHPALAVQKDLALLVLGTSRDAQAAAASRTPADVFLHLLSEYGELAEEVSIATGGSHKPEGADGVVGEAIDVVLCAVDLLYVLATTLQQPLPPDAFGTATAPLPRDDGTTPPLVGAVMGMVHPIGAVWSTLSHAPRAQAQRESSVWGAHAALTHLVSDCLRVATSARPDLTAETLLAVAARKCAKWRKAITQEGADHGA